MDIGTGKDLADYTIHGKQIPYHLIDICEPGTKYNLFEYQQDFYDAYQDIQKRGAFPILCGGTGLYIESVLKGYHLSPVPQNPELREALAHKSLEELTLILKELKAKTGSNMHNRTDVDTAQRAIRAIEIESYNLEHPMPERELPAVDSLIIGVSIDRDARREKISKRLKQRLDEGMVDEIKGLLDRGIPAENLIYYGLEYKFITEYVIGKTSYDEMYRGLEIAIHQFAKRQMTWFRGMERRISTNDDNGLITIVDKHSDEPFYALLILALHKVVIHALLLEHLLYFFPALVTSPASSRAIKQPPFILVYHCLFFVI